MIKWLGAMLILGGCTAAGFSMVTSHRKTEATLQQLIHSLEYMECELRYRMSPLPVVCREAADKSSGMIAGVLSDLAGELERQIAPDATICTVAVLNRHNNLPSQVHHCLKMLGKSLGRFDLTGQLNGMEAVRKYAVMELEKLLVNQESRLRSYQTLGICAGSALVILFL